MGLFASALKSASTAVSTGETTPTPQGSDWMGTLKALWAEYGTYVLIAGGVYLGWKYLLPMLGLRKGGRRGYPASLSKARRAKRAKAGRI